MTCQTPTAAAEEQRVRAVHEHVDLSAPPPAELDAVVRLVVRVTGNRCAVVNVVDETLQRQLAAEGVDPSDCAREDSLCRIPVAQGRLVHVADARADDRFRTDPWVDGRLGRVRSYASAPLRTRDGHVLGTLCAFDEEPRALSATQLADLTDLAALVVALFDRERTARRQAAADRALVEVRAVADVARSLQRTLLPQRLTGTDAVRLTNRYAPGTDGAAVGGDFYDAVRTDRALVLVMGDVQGRSSAAAAVMGRVRTAVRAYVLEGHDPSAVLDRTNRLVHSFDSDLFATCCLLTLDDRTGDVVVASAGHPAPLVVTARGVHALDVDPGPPLGVVEDGDAWAETRHHLDGPSRLLLHTDGITEWQHGQEADGTAALLRTLAEHAQAPAEELADRLLAPATRTGSDDAALLLADWAGPPTDHREVRVDLPEGPRAAAAARRELRRALAAWSLGAAEDGAELVVSELVGNAVVHSGTALTLTVQHDLTAGTLLVGVEDGSTRQPTPRDAPEEATGGRGLQIVDLVCERWWVVPAGEGKTVWAQLRVG